MELKANIPVFPERGDAAARPPEPPRSLRASESRCARSPRPVTLRLAEN